ncbi:MAG: hypothetical protein AAF687_12325 [Pseudomonadota bacterium]
MFKKFAIALPMAAIAFTGAFTCALPSAAIAQEASQPTVSVEARLLYEQSGKMSVNLAGNGYFTAYNTVIGEGSAQENASDMVIRAVIKADGQIFSETPLFITVYDSKGSVIKQRKIERLLLEKTTYRTMMLEDASCMGEITVEAKMGNSVQREDLNMLCGE